MSNEIVSTPRALLDAVEARFGRITWDLAANETNFVGKDGRYFGPGSEYGECSLAGDWKKVHGLAFLNPPFSRHTMKTFVAMVRKCAAEYRGMSGILLLTPAAVCTNWFQEHVAPNAYVFELTPRPFKKEVRDCVLSYFHPARLVGRETWKWTP